MKKLLIYLLVLVSPVAAQAAVTQLNALSWARADGTDQTVNMQRAVNAAATAGQSLFVPPGIVYTAASLTNTANVLIEDYTDLGQKTLRGALEVVSPPLVATTNYFGNTNVTQLAEGLAYLGTVIDRSNVKWWGAKGDGTTDDYAAIQAAITWAAAGAGVSQQDATAFCRPVYLSRGCYRITQPLVIPQSAGFVLYGDGGNNSATTIQWDGADGVNTGGYMLDARSCLGFSIRNLRFVGQADITDLNSAQIANGIITGRTGAGTWFNSYNSWSDVSVYRFTGVGITFGRYAGYSGGVYPDDVGQTDNSYFNNLNVQDCRFGIVINSINFLQCLFSRLLVQSYGGNPVDGGGVPIESVSAAPVKFRTQNAVRILYGDFTVEHAALIAPYDDGVSPEARYSIYCSDGTFNILSGYSEIYSLAYVDNGPNATGGTNIKHPNSVANFDMYSGAAGGNYDAAKYPIYYAQTQVPLTLTACDDIWVKETPDSAGVTAVGCRSQTGAIAYITTSPVLHNRRSSEINCSTMLYRAGVMRFESTTRIGMGGNLFSVDNNEFWIMPGFRLTRDATESMAWERQTGDTNCEQVNWMFNTNGLAMYRMAQGPNGTPYSSASMTANKTFAVNPAGSLNLYGTNTALIGFWPQGESTGRGGYLGFPAPGDYNMRFLTDRAGGFLFHLTSNSVFSVTRGLSDAVFTVNTNGDATISGTAQPKQLAVGATPGTFPARLHGTNANNYQLWLSNEGTYHTGFLAATNSTDATGWAMVGGGNTYQSGNANSVAVVLANNVPDFRIVRVSGGIETSSPTPLLIVNTNGTVTLTGLAVDPTTPADGTIWYNSTAHEYRGRTNGVTVIFSVTPAP